MRKPLPSQFGLPDDYDWNSARRKILIIKHAIGAMSLMIGLVFGCGAAIFILLITYFLFGGFSGWAVLPCIFAVYGGSIWMGLIVRNFIERATGEAQRERERRFAYACNEWQYRELESGPGFWERRTGRRFGEAVRSFFQRRGCTVELIETSDRFVVDLDVSMGDRSFYCRCDGHPRKPITHDSIREVAAISGRLGYRPMLVLLSMEYGPEEGDLAELFGMRILNPWSIADLARAEAFQLPVRRRSLVERLARRQAPVEVFAQWPLPPEPIKLLAPSVSSI